MMKGGKFYLTYISNIFKRSCVAPYKLTLYCFSDRRLHGLHGLSSNSGLENDSPGFNIKSPAHVIILLHKCED